MAMTAKQLVAANAKLKMRYEEYLTHFTENTATGSLFTKDSDIQTFFIMTLIQCHEPRVKQLLQACNKPIDPDCLKLIYTINLLNSNSLPVDEVKTSGNWYEAYSQWHEIVMPFLNEAVVPANISESVDPRLIENTFVGNVLKDKLIATTIIKDKVKNSYFSIDKLVTGLLSLGGLGIVHIVTASIEKHYSHAPELAFSLGCLKLIFSFLIIVFAAEVGHHTFRLKNSLFISKQDIEKIANSDINSIESGVLGLYLKAIILQSVIGNLDKPAPWLANRIKSNRAQRQANVNLVANAVNELESLPIAV